YGKSDKPHIDYTMDVFAKGVDAVLRDAGVAQAVLVGHSMGTPVVRHFYHLFPEKTRALVFVDGSLRPFIKDPKEGAKFVNQFKEDTFRETAPKLFVRMMRPDTPAAAREQIEKVAAAAEPHVAISSFRGMLDPKVWKDDPIKVPAQALMAKLPQWT